MTTDTYEDAVALVLRLRSEDMNLRASHAALLSAAKSIIAEPQASAWISAKSYQALLAAITAAEEQSPSNETAARDFMDKHPHSTTAVNPHDALLAVAALLAAAKRVLDGRSLDYADDAMLALKAAITAATEQNPEVQDGIFGKLIP